MTSVFRIAAVAAWLTVPAQAAEEATYINSQLFTFTGWCTGRDMVFDWTINGTPPKAGKAFIYPWLEHPIVIRGVEVTVSRATGAWSLIFGPANFRWLMVGNNAWGDIMISLPPGALYGRNFYPAGTGFKFPAKKDATQLTYIDIHGACWPVGWATVFLNIYYSR